MTLSTLRRRNTEVERDAFEATCERLTGFDDRLGAEAVEGCLCALAAGPTLPPAEIWLSALFGGTFERVFADPEDHAQALRSLQLRLKVLCDQLDPEALFDDPEALHLDPWLTVWDEAFKQSLIDDGEPAAEIAGLETGAEWAAAFLLAVQRLPGLWQLPADEEAEPAFAGAFDQIRALTWPADSDELKAHLAKVWPDAPPARDDLLAEALMSVQDLRMYWVDFAPRIETRRVEPTPGRNDPCPCGSGKKYKKCHGA